MKIEPQAKTPDQVPKSEGCVCPLCGHVNGFRRELLTLLISRQLEGGGHYIVDVGFCCETCGTSTFFSYDTAEDPQPWQDAIDLYGIAGNQTYREHSRVGDNA